ncbi:hypothetical protein, partial [uncultured Cetobacterium sp.]|uniref:hypothetical protein n=1 Tax=uncultured Cetobacterium sp. TaxID=527638 RepID=UPI0026089CF9
KQIDWITFSVKDIRGYEGSIDIQLEYSLDGGKTWLIYKIFNIINGMDWVDFGGRGSDKQLKMHKTVECTNGSFQYRFKFVGNGSISCKEDAPWACSAGGIGIIEEKYTPYEENFNNIAITSYDENSIKFSKSLLHSKGFISTLAKRKRSSRQHLKLYLCENDGNKMLLLDEVYTDNFISDLKLLPKVEDSYIIMTENEFKKPTVSLNPKIKQLLYKHDNLYINKAIIEKGTLLSKFGFKAVENIDVYSHDNKKLSNFITLDKISIENLRDIRFNDVSLGKDNVKDSGIYDNQGRNIMKCNSYFDITNTENDNVIIDKIKKLKTFKKLSVVMYDKYDDNIKNLIEVLSSCNKTPETVMLVCSIPGSSERYVVDKNTVGSVSFGKVLEKSFKENVGIQYINTEILLENVSSFLQDKIATNQMKSCTNITGVDIYNFSKSVVDSTKMSNFGYYINEVIDKVDVVDKINFINKSTSNSLKDVIQYDIGTNFEIEFDLKTVVPELNKEMFTEDGNFPGVEKPYYNISINHKENILFTYIVGEEIKILPNPKFEEKYIFGINDGILKVKGKQAFTVEDRGDNKIVVTVKKNDIVIADAIANFLVDYPEPSVEKMYIKAVDKINEVGYTGNKELAYTKDNFFEIGLNLNSGYNFKKDEYELELYHSKNKDYKIIKSLVGDLTSKIFTFNLDDIKDKNKPEEKIKFGEWNCKLVRKKFTINVAEVKAEIKLNLKEAIVLNAVPVDVDFDDFENNGLQQGKDVYISLKIINSNYFKTLKDVFTYVKEVRFISNNINFTGKSKFFTYLDENGTGAEHSLDFISNHDKNNIMDKRNELRWFISGSAQNDTTKFLNAIANLSQESKKAKNIKINLVLFTGEIIETATVTIGANGKVPEPIILGSSEHLDKIKMMAAKKSKKTVDSLTKEELIEINKDWKELGKSNYKNQQIINQANTFAFYSNLLEFKLDFGIGEYYTISQANNTTELIPITKDGVIRYILDENGIDEFGKGIVTIKSYIKLSDGTI